MDKLTTETLTFWRQTIEKVLQQHADIPHHYSDIRDYVIVSRDFNDFILMREGWHGKERFHGTVVHAEIRDDKIWIHFDGLEDSITEELVEVGSPKDRIVLSLHSPFVNIRAMRSPNPTTA